MLSRRNRPSCQSLLLRSPKLSAPCRALIAPSFSCPVLPARGRYRHHGPARWLRQPSKRKWAVPMTGGPVPCHGLSSWSAGACPIGITTQNGGGAIKRARREGWMGPLGRLLFPPPALFRPRSLSLARRRTKQRALLWPTAFVWVRIGAGKTGGCRGRLCKPHRHPEWPSKS